MAQTGRPFMQRSILLRIVCLLAVLLSLLYAAILLFRTPPPPLPIEPIATLEAPGNGGISDIALTPDGKILAAGCLDNTVKLFDLDKNQCVRTLSLDGKISGPVAISPDGQMLACAERPGTIRLWNLQSGAKMDKSFRCTEDVYHLAFAPDGNTLGSDGMGNVLKLWDLANGAPDPLFLNASMGAMAFSQNGRWLACATFDGAVTVWDLKANYLPRVHIGHKLGISALAFSISKDVLAVTGHYGDLKLWNVATHEKIPTPLAGKHLGITHLAFSPDATLLAASTHSSEVYVWRTTSWAQVTSFRAYDDVGISGLLFLPDSKTLITASDGRTFDGQQVDGKIDLWKVK